MSAFGLIFLLFTIIGCLVAFDFSPRSVSQGPSQSYTWTTPDCALLFLPGSTTIYWPFYVALRLDSDVLNSRFCRSFFEYGLVGGLCGSFSRNGSIIVDEIVCLLPTIVFVNTAAFSTSQFVFCLIPILIVLPPCFLVFLSGEACCWCLVHIPRLASLLCCFFVFTVYST